MEQSQKERHKQQRENNKDQRKYNSKKYGMVYKVKKRIQSKEMRPNICKTIYNEA